MRPDGGEVETVRWAFWRRDPDERSDGQVRPRPRPLPDDIGLPTSPSQAAAAPRDDDPSSGAPTRATPGSAAAPDAAQHRSRSPVPEPVALTVEGDHLDESLLPSSGARIAALVTALLANDPRAVDAAMADADPTTTRTAGAAAVGVLATRLPALSGADGAVAFDEDEGELLHAYTDLLVERCEPRRSRVAPGVDREDLMVVAHLAAATAAGDAAGEPTLLVLPGLPATSQLLAAGLLLAQTAQDGAGGPAAVSAEVRDLFG